MIKQTRFTAWVAWLLILLIPTIAWAAQHRLTDVRVSSDQGHSRIVLDVSGKTTYKYFSLHNPERLVVDLSNTRLATKLSRVKIANTDIKSIRSGHPSSKKLRIVFDLKRKASKKSFVIAAKKKTPQRIVFDLKSSATAAKVSQKKTQHKSTPYRATPRKIVVVIDAGHGGKDPGAIGPKGVYEKNVTLAISKKLQALLNKQPGITAKLTRKGNYYVSLRQRLRTARNDKGDIFIAIHADAFKNSRARGASVYALSERGASSEAARWLAEKENYSELGGGVDLSDKSNMLRSVLIDLSQTATIGASLQLGGDVLASLGRVARLHHNKVEQAAFVVLKSPDIPSILIETGFLSNPGEEAKLRTSSYQYKIARAIERGVLSYFRRHPPPGTWYAEKYKRDSSTYRVARGDSLSEIANKFSVSVASIKRVNGLRSNNIRIGQVLKIPSTRG